MSPAPRIVTLDGPAGVGKTTLAKRLAAHLGVPYLDTGAMYRAVGYILGQEAEDKPQESLANMLENLRFSLTGSGADTVLCLNGTPLGAEIRTEEVARLASHYAKLPVVRAALTKAQRAMGEATGLVAEGRDMGTVVFPQARPKFFLRASARVRAQRRAKQLASMGQPADLDEILAQIEARDTADEQRAEAPLKAASDAIVVDTSDLAEGEVFAALAAHLAG